MMVVFTSQSDKKAHKTVRWILDAFANRIGTGYMGNRDYIGGPADGQDAPSPSRDKEHGCFGALDSLQEEK